MSNLKIITQKEVLGKDLKVYGDYENPLFLAKDVASWIEHTNPTVMLMQIEESEKVLNNVYTLGGSQESWFVTEDGLMEILFQSRKPIAKEFKKQVKEILKEIRKTGTYTARQVKLTPQPKYRARMISTAVKDADATAKQLTKLFGVKDGIAYAAALQMVESVYQVDMSPVKKLLPAAEHEIGRLTATEIAKKMNINFKTGNPDAASVNRMLKGAGLMIATSNRKQPYELTVAGREYGESVPYQNGGHSGYEIRWNPSVIELLTKIKAGVA